MRVAAKACGLAGRGIDLHVGVHLVLDAMLRVFHLDAHLARARARVELVQHEGHPPFEGLVREGAERDPCRVPDPHLADVLLGDIGDDPDAREVGETVELLTSKAGDVGSMSMYDYDLNKVFRTLFLAGIEEVLAKHTDDAGCHGAWLFGRKDLSRD